jgi:hypothetical protein
VVVAKCIDLPESQQTRKIPNLSLSFSRNAIIYENEEEGDPEVTSTARISPECPGAPRKVSRNEFFS